MPDVSAPQENSVSGHRMNKLDILLLVGGFSLLAAAVVRGYFGSQRLPSRFDSTDVEISEGTALLVEFTSPYCYECKEVLPLLKAASRVFDTPLAVIDAKKRPDLASKYSIRSVPTILVVDTKGAVRHGWLSSPAESELIRALEAS